MVVTGSLALTAGPTAMEGKQAHAWHDIERRVIKALLSAGVRRVEEAAISPKLFTHYGAHLVWAGALRSIEHGARSVWLDGTLLASISTVTTPDRAREAIEWVRAAEDEPEDTAVDALVRSLRDRQFCAKVYELGARLRETVEQGTTDAAVRAEQVIATLRDLGESRYSGASIVEGIQFGAAYEAAIREERERAASRKPLPIFGLPTIDAATRQEEGTVTVLGAESYLGKTGLMTSAALATSRLGIGAVVVSVEDPLSKIVMRCAAEVARISTRNMVSGSQLDREEKVRAAQKELARLPLWGRRLESRSLEGVLALIRWSAMKGAKVVYLDYFQSVLMPGGGSQQTNTDRMNEGLYAMIAAAAERKIHLMILSQVKADENRKRPLTGYDLGESKKLKDAAANVVLFEFARKRQDEKRRAVMARVDKAKDVEDAWGTTARLVRDDFGILIEDGGPKGEKDEWGA